MRYRLRFVALAFLCSSPALALDLPPRKPGLWDIRMMFEAGNPMPVLTMQQCVDAATDKLMNSIGGEMRQDCPRQDVRKVGNTLVVDTVCRIEGITITAHGVITGDFNSAYIVKVTIKREGGPAEVGAPGTTTMTIENKWAGACKPDQNPGDIILPNGIKVNIKDLLDNPQDASPGDRGPPR